MKLRIAKAQARQKAYTEFMEDQNRQNTDDCKNLYELPSPSVAPPSAMTSVPSAHPILSNFSS